MSINAELSREDKDNRLQDALALSSLIAVLGAQEANNTVALLYIAHFVRRPEGAFLAKWFPGYATELEVVHARLAGSPEEAQLLHLGSVMGVRRDEAEGFVAVTRADEERAEALTRLSKCTDPGHQSFTGYNPGFVNSPPVAAEFSDLIPGEFMDDPRLEALYVALGASVRQSIRPLN